MEIEEYARIAAAEDEHWWYRNTRAVMADLLAPWLSGSRPPARVLDAGCGPGGNGAWLAAHGAVIGADLSREGLAFVRARRPETTPVCASLERLPFASGSFDVVAAVTVMYCVDDDRAAIRELGRVVAPGGVVLLMEPAFRWLTRAHDKTVHSRRRYTRAGLVERVRDAGLVVRRATYVYSFLVPPAALLALAERVRPHATVDAGSDVERRALDPVFTRLGRAERARLRRHDVRFGSTVAVLAERPG
ncbi:MAG: class I SAM-dependent methyltransferase [Actinomycetota bacterium]